MTTATATAMTTTTKDEQATDIRAEYCLPMLVPDDDWYRMRGDEPPCGPDYERVPPYSRHVVWG